MSRRRRRYALPFAVRSHACNRRRESIWQEIRCNWHENTPRIGVRPHDFPWDVFVP